jgi:hypothetical protein
VTVTEDDASIVMDVDSSLGLCFGGRPRFRLTGVEVSPVEADDDAAATGVNTGTGPLWWFTGIGTFVVVDLFPRFND